VTAEGGEATDASATDAQAAAVQWVLRVADAVELVLGSEARFADVTVIPKDPPLQW
jgi:hypothetical protein